MTRIQKTVRTKDLQELLTVIFLREEFQELCAEHVLEKTWQEKVKARSLSGPQPFLVTAGSAGYCSKYHF